MGSGRFHSRMSDLGSRKISMVLKKKTQKSFNTFVILSPGAREEIVRSVLYLAIIPLTAEIRTASNLI